MRTRKLIYFFVSFVLGAGVLFTFFQQLGLFEVKRIPIEISVSGEQGPAPASFEGAGLKERLQASVAPLIGKRVWEINLTQMSAVFVKDEWVKDVLISRSLPNGIHVRITQKNPVLIIVSRKGEFLPVTDEGEVLGTLNAGALPDVPILRGEGFLTDTKKRARAVEFVTQLPARGPMSARNISEISWNQEDGFTLTLIQPKLEVKLGDERMDLKALRVSQVLNYLAANQLKGRVIDASFSKKVLVRLRKAP
jgi:cell division protein FtsQ